MIETDQLIYGIRPMIESIKAGKEFDKVFVQTGLRGEQTAELFRLLKEAEIPFQRVPLEKLNRLTRKNHQGVVAFTSLIAFQPVEEIIQMVFERGQSPLILVLDRITDVRNFGAIARTAECAGVHAIVIPAQGSAQLNADAMKTSAGALNFIPIAKVKNLSRTLDHLKASGLQLVAATEKAQQFHTATDLSIPTVIMLGSEEDGISPAYLKKADHSVKIPITGRTPSLNVSVAAAVMIYEAVRQRMG
ncbi:MAG: 23S rRNA (guanosine(2251)-2'-O)-methyltransferase RlmB [Bacteroidales bacterium]|nr:23S rRNA (guanosine(2251)-2'-O)-methyltransferase RlmB [Bacteroidales bacterium]